jgi:hypothetical protein
MEDSPPGSGAGKHTEYALHVHLHCGLSYSVSRRYKSFYELDQQLQKQFPSITLPELPPRSLFSSSVLDQMDSRCAALNRYVKVMRARLCRAVRTRVWLIHLFISGTCSRSSSRLRLRAQVFGVEFGAAGSRCKPPLCPLNPRLSFNLTVLQILSVVDQASYEW